MVFIVFLLVNAGVAFVFFKYLRKRLSPIEILLYWCVSSLLAQNYFALQTMNFNSSVIPDELSLEFAHLLNRTVLYPVLSLVFMNRFCASQSTGTKWTCILGYAALATGLEWLTGVMNVFVHVWWRMPWSTAYWLIQFLLLLGVLKLYRHNFMTEAPANR